MDRATATRKTVGVQDIDIDSARRKLGHYVIRAGVADERIRITRYGDTGAYLIGQKDFERLVAFEERKRK